MTIVKKDGTFDRTVDNFVFHPLENADGSSFDVPSDTDPNALALDAAAYRIAFPTSHDGRGFSIARRLRERGYEGHLRASGNVLADQFPFAMSCGFNDVEVPDAQAERMPQAQWVDAASRISQTYQDRLMRHVPLNAA